MLGVESEGLTLICPIRGALHVQRRKNFGLSPTEEYFRVQAIRYLVTQGYPKENFLIETVVKKFGNKGRNSFRCDFVVLDCPSRSVQHSDPDEILKHALLLCEVKRDNAAHSYVKSTQVKPLLDFAKHRSCIALYWDNVEHRVFWNEFKGTLRETREADISSLPPFGQPITFAALTYERTRPTESLIDTFSRIEDILHTGAIGVEDRYQVMLQLLLSKLFDEQRNQRSPKKPLHIQDYASIGIPGQLAISKMNELLQRALDYYQPHLPKRVRQSFRLGPDMMLEICKILSPIRILDSRRDVLQAFYMKFAKDLYRWDLAQYFTPIPLTEFVVDVLKPAFGEHICDPACGSADFLTAALQYGRARELNFSDSLWGHDNNPNAVQISVLNMMLNGDGKTNIKHIDTLETIQNEEDSYNVILCNPPFGTNIVERRVSVLRSFDLGYHFKREGEIWSQSHAVLDGQEVGILFAEACIRMLKSGGRGAIILPNGYLGNRSTKYFCFRWWLLCNARIVGICSLPRFTFKTSGADVSASVIFFEKRKTPLKQPSEDEEYFFFVEMVEKVGWDAGTKRATLQYTRNEEDGSYLVSPDGSLIIDSDFDKIVRQIEKSPAIGNFQWLSGKNEDNKQGGWAKNIRSVARDPDLTLDPKRHCRKYGELRRVLSKKTVKHLGDIAAIVPELSMAGGLPAGVLASNRYQYVELQNMGYGFFEAEVLRGWQLPSRARHGATKGDIFVGKIWGSVGKWCYVGQDQNGLLFTNGCYRLQMFEAHLEWLIDLLAFINTEAWAVQMRAVSRGSDGLAEISEDDLREIFVPRIEDQAGRNLIESYLKLLDEGFISVKQRIIDVLRGSKLDSSLLIAERPSHIVLV
jgi:type I restriction enzyme M protein